jgi:hypothetical protein
MMGADFVEPDDQTHPPPRSLVDGSSDCRLRFLVASWSIGTSHVDRGVGGNGIPAAAWALHRSLAPRMEKWATARVASGKATQLTTAEISGTEWPVFGSAFYLMALESLQAEWEKDRAPGNEPRLMCRNSIEAVTQLVADPNHANWVKQHWGDQYLKHHNLFYRMLLISSFAAHERLLKTGKYVPFLRDQVETLSAELDSASSGLLNDYPGQCYHVDIAFAIRAIRNADSVLGTDHSAFVHRELRAFPPGVLPPYFADQATGKRGPQFEDVALRHFSSMLPSCGRNTQRVGKHCTIGISGRVAGGPQGYREFSRQFTAANGVGESYFDVDAGPVIAGFGTAASAFGIGSTRANGDSARARVLTLQALAVGWPVPSGGFFIPRLVSDEEHAPLLGECALLYALTQPTLRPLHNEIPIGVSGMVWMIMGLQICLGGLFASCAVRWWRRAGRIP